MKIKKGRIERGKKKRKHVNTASEERAEPGRSEKVKNATKKKNEMEKEAGEEKGEGKKMTEWDTGREKVRHGTQKPSGGRESGEHRH